MLVILAFLAGFVVVAAVALAVAVTVALHREASFIAWMKDLLESATRPR